MKVLLIGPHPPPHGGISVHVAGVRKALIAAGMTCHVLDISRVHPGFPFGWTVLRHALQGWTLHLHTNGHNLKSWLLALGCGLAGQFRGGCVLTLHSGMMPEYLSASSSRRRRLAVLTCSLYRQVICVNPEIRDTVVALGLDPRRTDLLPAYLCPDRPEAASEPGLLKWIDEHRPLFSTVLFFRPEYGFNLLVAGLSRLRRLYPSFGCLVMGSGEQRGEAERQITAAGLEENILLMGDVDHDSCLSLLSRCDVFLRPTFADGDAMSVREALSLGIPAVASKVGTRPAGAILFPPGNVDEMLAAIELALAMGRGTRLPSPGCIDRLKQIYSQVNRPKGSACLT